MATINVRLVTSPLIHFTADPALLTTALDRQEILYACSRIVDGLASALAALDEKICLSTTYVPRARRTRDQRWGVVSRHLDDAPQTAGRLGDAMQYAAKRCADLITDDEPVSYAGSLTEYHGRYTLNGHCSCSLDCEGVEWVHLRREAHLTCVNPPSIDPVPASNLTALQPATTAAMILDTHPRTLIAPVDIEPAITIVRGMSTITNHVRRCVSGWQDTFATRLNRRYLISPHTMVSGYFWRERILGSLDQARSDLTAVRGHLCDAVGVLAAIEADPEAGRRAA